MSVVLPSTGCFPPSSRCFASALDNLGLLCCAPRSQCCAPRSQCRLQVAGLLLACVQVLYRKSFYRVSVSVAVVPAYLVSPNRFDPTALLVHTRLVGLLKPLQAIVVGCRWKCKVSFLLDFLVLLSASRLPQMAGLLHCIGDVMHTGSPLGTLSSGLCLGGPSCGGGAAVQALPVEWPREVRDLISDCWAANPIARPSAGKVRPSPWQPACRHEAHH